jgi:DNA-3-methyladenine glycosylase
VGSPAAVLIRALEPTHGLEQMKARRRTDDLRLLAAGPGRLCEALGVTGAHDALPLDHPPFELLERGAIPEIGVGPRIGITKGVDSQWRYVLVGSRYLSRGLPRA